MMRRLAVALLALCLVTWPQPASAQLVAAAVLSARDQIFVSGREVRFDHLGTSRGEPVVRIRDNGLSNMLALIGAKVEFQPGTRFVAFTRSDGGLVTFTVGSNVVSVDDTSTGISFGPFYERNELYVPLLALARALGLSTHSFHGGYAFAPQLISVQRRISPRRTVVEVRATAPLAWRATYAGQPHHPTFVLTFPGFANAAGAKVELGGREAKAVTIEQQGPPGYPITSLTIDVIHGVKFAAHRTAGGSTMDLILARAQSDLAIGAVRAKGPFAAVSVTPRSTPKATPTPAPAQPSSLPSAATPSPSSGAAVPTAVPAPEVTDNSGATEVPSGSPSPEASGSQPAATAAPLQKITDVTVQETNAASRIILDVSGPVSFEWHRLADPDNRFWIDISQASLVGPARDVSVKLALVRSVKLSQHELTPDHVVRVSIDPSQPVDVVIGGIEGSPNQLGIEIRNTPPSADAPTSGIGTLAAAQQTPTPVAATRGPTQPNLIVIDPGHGGNDPGAINQGMGLWESHLTLAIAKHLKDDLERAGWRVTLTRDGDYEVGDPGGDDKQELQARCDIANAAGARLFISVHINSSTSSSPNGITTYFWRFGDRALAQSIQNATVQASGDADAGVHRENFYVIHHTLMSAVLVEAAYLSNAHDAAQLSQQWFLDKVAAGVAQGVKDFTGGPPAP